MHQQLGTARSTTSGPAVTPIHPRVPQACRGGFEWRQEESQRRSASFMMSYCSGLSAPSEPMWCNRHHPTQLSPTCKCRLCCPNLEHPSHSTG
jgi:hypothetical protein